MKLKYIFEELGDTVEVCEVRGFHGMPSDAYIYVLKKDLPRLAKETLSGVPVGTRIELNFITLTREEYLDLPENIQVDPSNFVPSDPEGAPENPKEDYDPAAEV